MLGIRFRQYFSDLATESQSSVKH